MDRRTLFKSAAALLAATPLASFAKPDRFGVIGHIGPEITSLPIGERSPLKLALEQGDHISFNCSGSPSSHLTQSRRNQPLTFAFLTPRYAHVFRIPS